MYDELVKRLRNRRICIQQSGSLADFPLLAEAADAIEERCQQVDKFAAEAARLYAKQPRWIPVTERLPEKMQYVLVRYQNNDMAVASWFGGDEHIRFWRAMTDEGWCADCDTEPTHWMPLPQPPKEET